MRRPLLEKGPLLGEQRNDRHCLPGARELNPSLHLALVRSGGVTVPVLRRLSGCDSAIEWWSASGDHHFDRGRLRTHTIDRSRPAVGVGAAMTAVSSTSDALHDGHGRGVEMRYE